MASADRDKAFELWYADSGTPPKHTARHQWDAAWGAARRSLFRELNDFGGQYGETALLELISDMANKSFLPGWGDFNALKPT
jgi:hypothetical protein